MKRRYVLRGRGAFNRVFALGRRLEGSSVRAVVQVERNNKPQLRVGFSVSSRRYNAVTRNRLRRLMREAVRQQLAILERAVQREECTLLLIFVWKSGSTGEIRRMTLEPVAADVRKLCGQVVHRCSKADW